MPAAAPLFTTLLNYRHTPVPSRRAEGYAAARGHRRCLHSQERTNYPLMLSVDDLGRGFALTVQVRARRSSRSGSVRCMHRRWRRLVEALEQAPQSPIRTIEVLPEAERAAVLVEWNATQRDYPQEQADPRAVRGTGGAHAEAMAVVCGGQQLTLCGAQRAGQSAGALPDESGVGPDQRVGDLCGAQRWRWWWGCWGS